MPRKSNNQMQFDAEEPSLDLGFRPASGGALETAREFDLAPVPMFPFLRRGEGFLLINVGAVIAKACLFAFIEDFGRKAWIEGIASDIIFGAIALVMLYQYFRVDWIVNQWLVFARTILIVPGLITAAHVLGGGGIWEGRLKPIDAHTMIVACAVTVITLLLAASSLTVYGLFHTQRFLDHPIEFMKRGK